MSEQLQIMHDAGYVSAAEAMDAIGLSQVGGIHNLVKKDRLTGMQVGRRWYVSVASLLEEYKDAPPIVSRIKALGVEAKRDTELKKKGPTNGRRTG